LVSPGLRSIRPGQEGGGGGGGCVRACVRASEQGKQIEEIWPKIGKAFSSVLIKMSYLPIS